MARNFFFLSVVLVLLVFRVHGAQAQVFSGPAVSGTGGAGRAAVDLGESSFLNPAAVAFLQSYNLTGFYGASSHPTTGNINEYGALVGDGSNGAIIPGAVSYVRRRIEGPGDFGNVQQDIQLSMAGYLHQKVALGVAGHRLSDQIAGGEEITQWNMHVGLIYVPIGTLGLGFVAYDLLPADSAPANIRVVPTLAVGVNYLYQKFFRARLDLVRPDTNNDGRRMNVMAGLETFFSEFFALRLGSEWRETSDQNYLTAGLGYKGPRLSFDYSFQKDVRNSENCRHLIDLWLAL